MYIVASAHRTLYTGVTGDLEGRVFEHREGAVEGFSKRYNCNRLVYCEATDDVFAAIGREKQIKGWVRRKKVDLIEERNPKWRDLSAGWGLSSRREGRSRA